jgi:hypothetical protein
VTAPLSSRYSHDIRDGIVARECAAIRRYPAHPDQWAPGIDLVESSRARPTRPERSFDSIEDVGATYSLVLDLVNPRNDDSTEKVICSTILKCAQTTRKRNFNQYSKKLPTNKPSISAGFFSSPAQSTADRRTSAMRAHPSTNLQQHK